MIKTELLAPAGNMDKLKTAIYFGADAVYVGGKDFSLRSYSDNFTEDQLKEAIGFVHDRGKKLYVTLNIFAKNADFDKIADYAGFVYSAGADAVIVSDPGVFAAVRKICPDLNVHISTQANTLNKYSAAFWAENGAKRIILARELSLKEIAEIRAFLPADVEVEAFCHGAMCISYSGRCLLSDYYTGRQSNRGECVQACRWKYAVRPYDSDGAFCDVEQDEKGTYFFNSKDLNMIGHLDEMVSSGVYSFKIEGRMKSEYYLATVVNAYRRALDALSSVGKDYKKDGLFESELLKTNHRAFTTAYMLGDNRDTVNYDDSQSAGDRTFIASVVDYDEKTKTALIEMRNRFMTGDVLEVLTPNEYFNKTIKVERLTAVDGTPVADAKIVQQKLLLKTNIRLHAGDVLRK